MFSKVYKLKSNNTLKNSEKKQLVQRVLDSFLDATEDKVKELLQTKMTTTCMRLITYSGDAVSVYVVEGEPILLEMCGQLYPTMCALWKLPNLIPTITIHSLVLGKIQNGAPLYLPGVSIPAQGRGFPRFLRGAALAINTESNGAAAAVGTALMSSGDMLLKGSGVCMETLHVVGDQLCKDIKFNKVERPAWGPASYITPEEGQALPSIALSNMNQPIVAKEEWPELGSTRQKKLPTSSEPSMVPNKEKDQKEETGEGEEKEVTSPHPDNLPDPTLSKQVDETNIDEQKEDHVPDDMDGLLRWCLLSFLKQEGRRLTLPLKTNLLYKNHLMPLCPSGRILDVKKSTYKKMGKFLEAMEMEGLIETREVDKGVSALVAVNMAHPALRMHAAPDGSAAPTEPEREYTPPVVRELLAVTAPTAPLLPPHRKGEALTSSEARTAFTAYVHTRGLQDVTDPRRLRLDEPLAALLGAAPLSSAPWDEVWKALSKRMTACTELRFSDGTVSLLRTRLPPVNFAVATRSGNKKVTLVSNLEPFGFNLVALAKTWQSRAAAAVTVTRTASAAKPQLLLQGDQTYFVAKMLVEEYGLPKKFVEGADKALSKKRP